MIQSVTVYCSSRTAIDAVYMQAGAELGTALAHSGRTLIYGGNAIGLMKTLADAARAAGGKVIGITTGLLDEKGNSDTHADKLIVADDLSERKILMEQAADAFIALPGGPGTWDELFQVIAQKQLGYHNKPILLLNINQYYAPLLAMFDTALKQGFVNPKHEHLFKVADTVPQAMHALNHHQSAPLAPPRL